jgi:CubicO group peptidase (beta-lactamase class C family)
MIRYRNLVCNLISVLIAITLLSPLASAQAQAAPGPDLQAVDAYLQALVKANRIAGLAVAVVQGDQIIFLRGYGEAGLGRPMTPQTQLYIGSVTKSFTALAVMQLVEQGKLELDAPVQRYLPWFQVADAAASAQITVRHLLNHTSGLCELGDPNASTYAPTLADEARTLRQVRPTAPVGIKFQYYNKNYRVLGLLIEQASGQAYGDYMRAHVFTPLGMAHTVANPSDALDLAQSYSQAFGFPMPYPLTFHPSAAPSGYIISSAEDIARYLIAQINDGRIQDHALVQPATLAQMRTPPPGIGSRYGMGWMVVEDGNTLFHGGDLEGFHALVGMGLKEKIGFVILCNQNSLTQMLTVYDALPGDLSSLLMSRTRPKPNSFAWVGLVLAILMAADFLNHLRLFWQLPAWVKKTARQSRVAQWLKILPRLIIALVLLLGLPSLLSAVLGSSGGWLDMFGLLPDVTAWLFVGLTLVLIRGVAKIILLARQPVTFSIER